jgi:TP901 family phage tail tape measure protein
VSGASEIGVRISLIGGKEVAVQNAAIAGSIDAIAVSADTAVPSLAALSGGMDLLSTSVGGVTTMTGAANTEFLRTTGATDALIASNAGLIASNDALMANVVEVDASIAAQTTELGFLNRGLFSVGLSSEAMLTKVRAVGKGLAIAFVAAGAIIAVESMKMAVSFDKSTASIAANANISMNAAGNITKAFLTTAGSMAFNAQEMATAYAPVAGQLTTVTGKAQTTGQAMQFMHVSMGLADASGSDLTATTADLSSIMQVYHYTVSQASTASNILYNTSRLTANSISALDTVTARLHSRLGQTIPSLKDTSALLLDLAEHGAKGSRGTMVVVSAMTTLLGGAKNTVSMLQMMGISANAFIGPNGKFIGMAKAIDLLQPKLAMLNSQQQLYAEKALFGAGASQLMGQMILSGSSAYEKASARVNQYGVVQSAANKYLHSVPGEINIVKSAFHDFMITLGSFLLPKLIAFGTWMVKHKPILYGFATLMGVLIVGAIGAYIASLLIAIPTTILFWTAVTGGFILAAAVLIAGGLWLIDHWHQVWTDMKNWVMDAWHFIDDILHNKFVLMFMGPIGALIYLGEHWKTVWHDIVAVVEWAWEHVAKIVDKFTNGFDKARRGVASFFSGGFHALGFAEGGVVPGPIGAPMMAVVHGGEVIAPPQNIYSSGSVSSTLLGMSVSKVAPVGTNAAAVPGMVHVSGEGGGTTVIQLVVDGKVLAEAVYKQVRQDYARR